MLKHSVDLERWKLHEQRRDGERGRKRESDSFGRNTPLFTTAKASYPHRFILILILYIYSSIHTFIKLPQSVEIIPLAHMQF
jgi:hypothetical protein